MATQKTRADFRVQVWSGPNATEGQRHALNRAVLQAVQKTGVWGERVADSVRMADDGQGESSVYWSVNNVKRVDEKTGETLVVDMVDGQAVVVPNFHLKPTRVERRGGQIVSVAWDTRIEGVNCYRMHTTTYIAGRNGVAAIRIERV